MPLAVCYLIPNKPELTSNIIRGIKSKGPSPGFEYKRPICRNNPLHKAATIRNLFCTSGLPRFLILAKQKGAYIFWESVEMPWPSNPKFRLTFLVNQQLFLLRTREMLILQFPFSS